MLVCGIIVRYGVAFVPASASSFFFHRAARCASRKFFPTKVVARCDVMRLASAELTSRWGTFGRSCLLSTFQFRWRERVGVDKPCEFRSKYDMSRSSTSNSPHERMNGRLVTVALSSRSCRSYSHVHLCSCPWRLCSHTI